MAEYMEHPKHIRICDGIKVDKKAGWFIIIVLFSAFGYASIFPKNRIMCEGCEEKGHIHSQSVSIDNEVPLFEMPAYDPIKDDEIMVDLESYRGKWTVLFYYPADFTFVCPTELKDMMDAKGVFDELGVTVFAISTDTQFSHRAWVKHEKLMQGFPYLMLSDHALGVAEQYGVLDYKTGIAARGTFIIDPDLVCRGIEITSGPLGRNSDELIRKIRALQYLREHPGTACPAKWVFGDKTLKPSIKISGEVGEELE